MPEERTDRRVGRTRRRLKRALMELIRETDYESITVRELTERADVGRSTFYSHFRDKEDLLFDGFDDWLLSLVGDPTAGHEEAGDGVSEEGRDRGPGPAGEARFGFSLPLLRHIGSQRRFFQATILGGRGARVRRRTTGLFVRMMRAELERAPGGTIAPSGRGGRDTDRVRAADSVTRLDPRLVLEARARCLTGAFLELASWWLAERRKLPPEDVDALFRAAMGPGTGLAASPGNRADRPGPP